MGRIPVPIRQTTTRKQYPVPAIRLEGLSKWFLLSLFLVLAVCFFFSLAHAEQRYCGSERQDVKTMQDKTPVSLDKIFSTSVDKLRSLPAPAWGNHTPRHKDETIVYSVQAVIVGFKYENAKGGDGDYHIVIASTKDVTHTMIVEIPHPDCGRAEDAARFEAMRGFISALHKPGPSFFTLPKPVPVSVQGVLFFDKIHGQTGVAPNGVELHPVLSIVSQ